MFKRYLCKNLLLSHSKKITRDSNLYKLCCTVINGVEASTKWTASVGNNYRTRKEVTFHTVVIIKYDKFMICIRSDQWCRFGDDTVGYIDSKHIFPSGCGRPST